jgi:hypothetical protein
MDDANPIAQLGGEFQHAMLLQDHDAMREPEGGLRIGVGADVPVKIRPSQHQNQGAIGVAGGEPGQGRVAATGMESDHQVRRLAVPGRRQIDTMPRPAQEPPPAQCRVAVAVAGGGGIRRDQRDMHGPTISRR